jgi:hypothetical protein
VLVDVIVVVVVVVNVVGDGDELDDASSGRADGHEPICTQSESVREKTGVLGVDPFDSPRASRFPAAAARPRRNWTVEHEREHGHGRQHRNRPAEM